MGGIFGIVHLDGSPTQPSQLAVMHSAMRKWGPDGGGSWSDGPAGLGQLVSFDTPEARLEHGPRRSLQGFHFVCEARLDARSGLCVSLGLTATEAASLPDGELVLRSYERWGRRAPDHLLGDWSFGAWHPHSRVLFLARDHFGSTSLYYCLDEHRFAFASSRKALFALGVPRRLNEFFLACTLVSWTAQHGSPTIDLDVQRLPPAHTLVLSNGRPQVDQYWRLEDTPIVRQRTSSDYADGLLAVYDTAIRDRLRSAGPIGIALSGGLDSGSTAVLASRALPASNGRLRAYTSVPLHDVTHANGERTVGDETTLARATADSVGNIDLILFQAGAVTPIQGIRSALAIHDEPAHAAGNMFWLIELLGTAARDGARTLLTAQGGNATVSWAGVDHAGMLKRLIRHGYRKQALEVMFYPRLPLGLIRMFRSVRHRRGLDWSKTSINEAFARRIGLSELYIAHSGDATKSEEWYPERRQRLAIIRPGASLIGTIWSENAAAYDLDIRDATYDRRVMEYTFSIPDNEFRDASGMDRRMLRLAMEGLLPDEVRLNRRRGMQAADLGHRLRASAAEVEATLTQLDHSPLATRYLNLGRMRVAWQSLLQRVDGVTTHDAVTILTRGLMAGLHLVDREGLA